MFTGLIEEIGAVRAVTRNDAGYQLVIEAGEVLDGVRGGDSIAVNGVCLTVTAFDAATFTVGLAPETRAKTNLEDLAPGAPVNLERAALPTTRMGGHYVQGHVDATGVIRSSRPDHDALWLTIEAPRELMRYIVPKGYIAVDGASLTVVHTGPDWFDVTLIAYSQEKLALPRKKPGERVNLEVDILAKYIERLLAPENSPLLRDALSPHPEGARRARHEGRGERAPQDEANFPKCRANPARLTKDFLADHGFLKEGAY